MASKAFVTSNWDSGAQRRSPSASLPARRPEGLKRNTPHHWKPAKLFKTHGTYWIGRIHVKLANPRIQPLCPLSADGSARANRPNALGMSTKQRSQTGPVLRKLHIVG